GQTITGASVHLARELARVWGNVQYGLVEMRRDDEYGQSEMQAFAWDVQTNSRNSSTFIVPHRRDTKNGPKQLTDMRDIYETNANNGARRVRAAIFAILPPWFVEEAKELCNQTLRDGGGKPLAQRVADAIKTFEGIGITADRIENRLDRLSTKWTEHDVAQLIVIYKSTQRGEVTTEDEFPAPRVSAHELTGRKADKPATTTHAQQPTRTPGPPAATQPASDPARRNHHHRPPHSSQTAPGPRPPQTGGAPAQPKETTHHDHRPDRHPPGPDPRTHRHPHRAVAGSRRRVPGQGRRARRRPGQPLQRLPLHLPAEHPRPAACPRHRPHALLPHERRGAAARRLRTQPRGRARQARIRANDDPRRRPVDASGEGRRPRTLGTRRHPRPGHRQRRHPPPRRGAPRRQVGGGPHLGARSRPRTAARAD